MAATGYQRAVYLPANPSKGRIIRHGAYYIKEVRGKGFEVRDVPLHETAFSYDPEFPAKTSVLRERFPEAEALGIMMPDAESDEDIRHVIATYDDGNTLFAGAADLFTALTSRSPLTSHRSPLTSHCSPLTSENTLILCGSTQSKPLDIGIPIAPMPREVYDGEEGADYWWKKLSTSLPPQRGAEGGSLILTIPYTHRTGKAVAVHLRSIMARMARRLTDRHRPDHLIIEGGATAWATLQSLGWTEFEIVRQIAPGVVQMRGSNGTLVTLKPGSYPWGDLWSFGSSSNLDKQ